MIQLHIKSNGCLIRENYLKICPTKKYKYLFGLTSYRTEQPENQITRNRLDRTLFGLVIS